MIAIRAACRNRSGGSGGSSKGNHHRPDGELLEIAFTDADGQPVEPRAFNLVGLPRGFDYDEYIQELFLYSCREFDEACIPSVHSLMII